MPLTNTHVHIPPNFSAFATVQEAIAAAKSQNVRVLGVSNFYDQHVYALVRDLTEGSGVLMEYGVEVIAVVPDLEASGIRINDPANPGRMYLTGKGIDPFRPLTPRAAETAQKIRSGNDARARLMVEKVVSCFAEAGFETGLDADQITSQVAERAQVPVEWVSLQERHIAQAFQEALEQVPPDQRNAILTRVYGSSPQADVSDPVAVQAEIRSRLLKAGTPGFVPEVPLSFDDAYAYILDMGGIPCYPIMADGCDPACPFEESPAELSQELLKRGIHAAELIPNRNHRDVVDTYVRALTGAGLIVMAGTENNTHNNLSLVPTCVDGELSPYSKTAFYEGTCVVMAHVERSLRGDCGNHMDRRLGGRMDEGTSTRGGQ